MDAMRNVMGELRPQGLDDYGLVAPLRTLASTFSDRTGIRVDIDCHSNPTHVRNTVALAMFRIAQEALNNVAKHSEATVVRISYDEGDGQAVLTITDNGIGIEPTRAKSGWGLLIMRERAEAVGATLTIGGSRSKGMTVAVHYRLPEPNSNADMAA
jgi:two-component system sensor kinase